MRGSKAASGGVEWMRSQGLKFPCGRKKKGTQGPVLVGKALLNRKAMQATATRIRRIRTKVEIAQQLQDRLATEAAARAKAERDKILGLAPPSPGPDIDQPFINWDAVAKRAINAQFAKLAHDKWIRGGGASLDDNRPHVLLSSAPFLHRKL
jgi:hypothetical protein